MALPGQALTASPPQTPLSVESLSTLIAALNRGPLESPAWHSFLRLLREMCGGKAVALMCRRPQHGDAGIVFVEGLDITATDQINYANEFGALDPFIQLPDSVAVTLDELIPPASLQASEYYQRFMVPNDQMQFLGMDVYENRHIDISLRVIRGGGDARFGAAEKRVLQLLQPHLKQLMQWWHNDQRIEAERSFYESALTRLAMATVFLSQDLRVVHSNPVAQRLLGNGDGLSMVKDQLRAGTAEDNQKLQAMLKLAATTGADAVWLPQPITIRRRNVEFPLYLVVRPLSASGLAGHAELPRVAVFINAPELRMLSPEAIQQLLGFTPREAQIVIAIVNGLSLEAIAEEGGVSRNTVRAHLYSVFRKIGVNQQSALVSVVMRSVLGLE